jgi:hypothetical protein
LSQKADILLAKGDVRGAKAALTEAVDLTRTLPVASHFDKTRADLEKRLAGLTSKK